ncbi:MAG: hypothetical protein EOP85_22725 [Verrucomicrobiaceae bacterium]|nr:MAG: hypothetical protein EOP85_22725 [Verrucomicrobiaceae bacterium]
MNAEAGEPFEYAIAAGDRETLRENLSQVLDSGIPVSGVRLNIGGNLFLATVSRSLKPDEDPIAIITLLPG